MIKAAFFDIDGTLLSFQTHRVSTGTLRAFDRLHRAGIRTFISTGRPRVLIPSLPLHFDGHVTMNGGRVYTLQNTPATGIPPIDKILVANPIPLADSEAYLRLAEERGVCLMVFTAEEMYVSQVNDTAIRLHQSLDIPMPTVAPISELHDKEAYQIISITPPQMDAELSALMPSCHMPRWSDVFTDIVNRTNSKASGLEAICHHYGIQQQETLAFGDGGNDIDMLRWAGIGVAMGNAADDVKQAADRVTADVDHEGIEQAVEEILSASL